MPHLPDDVRVPPDPDRIDPDLPELPDVPEIPPELEDPGLLAEPSLGAVPGALAAAPFMIGDGFGGLTQGSASLIPQLVGESIWHTPGVGFGVGDFHLIDRTRPGAAPGTVTFQGGGGSAADAFYHPDFETLPPGTLIPGLRNLATDEPGFFAVQTQDTVDVEDYANPFDPDAVPQQPREATFQDATVFSIFNEGQPQAIVIPSPTEVVGRMKMAENSSPMPRDRVFFNYSHFHNVPLTRQGLDVDRFSPGFEKTFFDGMTSLEVRTPFAGTLDSTIVADQPGMRNVEFGNVMLAGKALLTATDVWAFSTGLALQLPTASDVRVRTAGGQQLVRIENESVHLMPFFGALYTPNDRFFAQSFLQFDFDANGNPVYVAGPGNGLQRVGRVDDIDFLYASISAGYWLYRNCDPCARVTGLAPIMELHYNRSLGREDMVQANGFQIGGGAGNIENMNLVIGGSTEFGYTRSLTAAFVTPVMGGRDRQFDGELRVFVNWLFGPATRQTRVPL